ncbi:unnamed protein product [Rhizoctonia solani]|nr:unnamed protein product [Rhizoctonia solani]
MTTKTPKQASRPPTAKALLLLALLPTCNGSSSSWLLRSVDQSGTHSNLKPVATTPSQNYSTYTFSLTMNPPNLSAFHQILVMGPGASDSSPVCLLNSHANVKYEIVPASVRGADIRRNGELVATIRLGWLGQYTINMRQNDQRRAPDTVETSGLMRWRKPRGTPPRVKWMGIDYFCAIHIKNDRVIATYDPREATLELKGSLALENKSDADIVSELVASWVIYNYRARQLQPAGWGAHSYPWTQFDENYKKYGIPTPGSCTAVEARRTPDYTLTSPSDQKATTSKGGSLVRNGAMVVTAFEGNFNPQKIVTPFQDDCQLVRMKDAMTQTNS